MEIVDPQTGRPPDDLSRDRIEVALTQDQAASGTIIEGRPEGLFVIPGAEHPIQRPPSTEGIIEEDLPKND